MQNLPTPQCPETHRLSPAMPFDRVVGKRGAESFFGWYALAVLVSALAVAGCAPTTARVQTPRVDPIAIERTADAERGRGCYLCLRSAAEGYEHALANGGASGLGLKAAGAWALVAARERELGMKKSDALERASRHRTEGGADVVDAYQAVVSSLPWHMEGVSKEAQAETAAAARSLFVEDRVPRRGEAIRETPVAASAAVALLRERSGSDLAARYLDLSIGCSGIEHSPKTPTAPVSDPLPPNLIGFRLATCSPRRTAEDLETLNRLGRIEPRFHEVHLFLGQQAVGERRLVTAEKEFFGAADGLPQMTAAWTMLGAARLSLEDYDAAAADFSRALGLEPDQREAMLNLAQALNYAGRFEEALRPSRRLIELGAWYLSDAHYWLAFSELQLGYLDDADLHVREARRTNPMNGDTAKLSGLVAYRRAEFDRARSEFEHALSRNEADCESRLHLGMIHGQQSRLVPSIEAFLRARDCYATLADAFVRRRAGIEESPLTEVRKEIALLRLAQKIAGCQRSRAAAALGAAEGEEQRGADEAASQYATDAATHPDFAKRAAELSARVASKRARR